ncbi:hypothetical protein Micbo1qcDRAFT_154565 [Microdochium bolleyi]|uniref:Zn(2)-C6 fungal-type domain-containing protein n=1 Tax=Microdochium bolleyi TaxID=196109 RepID=A0A136IJ06_9PEZI|nr:hypothetical protein Micbo1qcDRAFT_154565 [Microdochium bolleyi]
MAPRRSHYKSRRGCEQCKARRVKCNEAKPSCQNCVRRRVQCTYSFLAQGQGGRETESSALLDRDATPAEPTAAPSSEPCSPDYRTTRRVELQLMHHYSTATCETMGNTPQQREIWRIAVPQEAASHDFLMDGILSVTACHRAHADPSRAAACMTAALHYQNSGLRGYQSALGSIGPGNCQAIFAFSVMLTVLGFAMPPMYPESQPVSAATSLSCIFELLKGVKVTTDEFTYSIQNGIFAPLFTSTKDPAARLRTVPVRETEGAMAQLRKRTQFVAKYVSAEVVEIYQSSVDSLEGGFREVSSTQTFNLIIAWPVMVDPRMVGLFNKRDPLALLIWLHYAVLTLSVHDQWWGRGFGVRLVEDLSRILHDVDPEWDPWTAWAREYASLFSGRA